MKAMSLGLLRGTIDQVEEYVHVDWIMPRYLTADHMQVMVDKLAKWEESLTRVIRHVEDSSAELIST